MSEKQQQILETLKKVLPQMSNESQNYLLGFGEGMATILEQDEREEKNSMKEAG